MGDATRRQPDGLLSKVTNFFNSEKVVAAEQYQVRVSDVAPLTRVAILTKAGASEDSQTTQRILSLLHEQLK